MTVGNQHYGALPTSAKTKQEREGNVLRGTALIKLYYHVYFFTQYHCFIF